MGIEEKTGGEVKGENAPEGKDKPEWTRTGQIWAFGVSSKVTCEARAICQWVFGRATKSSRSTHPADGEEQTLQFCELSLGKTEETRRIVLHCASSTLVPREGIYTERRR